MKEFSVSQLNNYIKNVFDDEFVLNDIQVKGEVVQYNTVRGNSFFVVSDQLCSIDCIKFGKSQDIKVGSQVVVAGSVKFYPKSGNIKFIANSIKLVDTRGQKLLAFLALKEKLQKQGLFENRLPMPTRVDKVAIITSKEGAVIHDFVSVARKLNQSIDIVVCSCKVQGEGSEIEIAQAIANANAMADKPQCIVLARGGGSTVDLDTFNTEVVAMAVANTSIPIVSAIGHESDYTLCDFVASARAGTPSIAAQMVVPDNAAYVEHIIQLSKRLNRAIDNVYYSCHNKVETLLNTLTARNTQNLLTLHNQTKRLLGRASNALDNKFAQQHNNLSTLNTKLEHNNPAKLLTQGYAKLMTGDKNVNSKADTKVGDNIKIFVSDGCIGATVTDVERVV